MHRLTLDEAARRFSIPPGTLRSWASRGSITPCAIHIDGTKFYALSALEAMAESRTRHASAGTGHA